MRDPARIRHLLSLIEDVWTKYPDLRLGQLIVNAVGAEHGHTASGSNVFYVEDETLIAHFEAMLSPVTKRDL